MCKKEFGQPGDVYIIEMPASGASVVARLQLVKDQEGTVNFTDERGRVLVRGISLSTVLAGGDDGIHYLQIVDETVGSQFPIGAVLDPVCF